MTFGVSSWLPLVFVFRLNSGLQVVIASTFSTELSHRPILCVCPFPFHSVAQAGWNYVDLLLGIDSGITGVSYLAHLYCF